MQLSHLRGAALIALVLGAGCHKDPPAPAKAPVPPAAMDNATAPAPTPRSTPKSTASIDRTLCERAHDNLIAVNKAASSPVPVVRKMEAERKGFLERCAAAPERITRCLAEAPDRKTASACAEVPTDNATLAEGRTLCAKAYDHVTVLVKREGAPATALEQMKDRRDAGIAECLREDPAKIRCLLATKDLAGVASCQKTGKPEPAPPEPGHAEACDKGFANMIAIARPGLDLPQNMIDDMKKKPEAFRSRCLAAPRSMADCVASAPDFAALKKCHEPPN